MITTQDKLEVLQAQYDDAAKYVEIFQNKLNRLEKRRAVIMSVIEDNPELAGSFDDELKALDGNFIDSTKQTKTQLEAETKKAQAYKTAIDKYNGGGELLTANELEDLTDRYL